MSILTASRTLLLVLLLASPAVPALAQVESREGIALQNQILELQRQVQSLRDRVSGGGGSGYLGRNSYSTSPPSASSNDLVAQLLSRVTALEDQVRQLRGRIDETENQVQRQGADLGKRIDDLAFQTQNPGAGPPQVPGQTSLPLTGPQPTRLQPPGQMPPTMAPPPGPLALTPQQQPGQPPVPIHRTPEMAMQEGNAALARRDYIAAEQDAREVLTGNRTSPRAYDAQFLLAQALLGQRQFSQAAIAYDDTFNRARKGQHSQDALLGLASSLVAINEKKAACDTLGKLHAEFPSPRPDLREAIGMTTQRAGCR